MLRIEFILDLTLRPARLCFDPLPPPTGSKFDKSRFRAIVVVGNANVC